MIVSRDAELVLRNELRCEDGLVAWEGLATWPGFSGRGPRGGVSRVRSTLIAVDGEAERAVGDMGWGTACEGMPLRMNASAEPHVVSIRAFTSSGSFSKYCALHWRTFD